MKAIIVSEYGGPQKLRVADVPDPQPAPGELLIRLDVAGVNFIDTYHRRGLYPVGLPFTPGIEGAGRVIGMGDSVEGFSEGDRAIFCLASGAYAEKAVVPAWKTVALPDTVAPETGVACMCQGMTAHYLITDCFRLEAGQTALVHAAAGGVGLLLVQMAKLAGATVIGTVSTEEKAELARKAGADHMILYSKEDFVEAVRRLTEGSGVDVVYESVGRDTFSGSLDCMKPRGYVVLFGQSSGPVDAFDPQVLNQKGSLFLTRPSLGHYVPNGEEFRRRAGEVLDLAATGRLKVTVGDQLPLEEASEAHRRLEGRRTVGKVVLRA